MAISPGDRFILLCKMKGIDQFEEFEKAFWKQQVKAEVEKLLAKAEAEKKQVKTEAEKKQIKAEAEKKKTNSKALHKAFNGWKRGRKLRAKNYDYFLAALNESGWPERLPPPDDLLDSEMSVPEFLDACKLVYEDVEHLLSDESIEEWRKAHHNLFFMKALDEQARTEKAKLLMPNLVGTYALYRRHSILPGLLREYFVIEKIKDGHCEGKYIQFARAQPDNVIPFNGFFCEFYVIAFGAHQAVGGRTEIVTVSILIENAFSGDMLIPRKKSGPYFMGLLSGIYDSGNVLLAERILIEKIAAKPKIKTAELENGKWQLESPEWAPVQLHEDHRKQRGEYLKALDVIDNSLDGQTLTARLSRLEMVRG